MGPICTCKAQLQPHDPSGVCPVMRRDIDVHVHDFISVTYRDRVIDSKCWCGARPIDQFAYYLVQGEHDPIDKGWSPDLTHETIGFTPTCWICAQRQRDWAVTARREARRMVHDEWVRVAPEAERIRSMIAFNMKQARQRLHGGRCPAQHNIEPKPRWVQCSLPPGHEGVPHIWGNDNQVTEDRPFA